MGRTSAPVEVVAFVRGLITEVSPLTFPEGASLAEDNFVLSRDGSRQRRLGMDLESNQSIQTDVAAAFDGLAISEYTWDNAGGIPDKKITVVQIGASLYFFDQDVEPLVDGYLNSVELKEGESAIDPTLKASYAVVDGILFVASGVSDIAILLYDGTSVESDYRRILTRDLFGVHATGRVARNQPYLPLREGNNIDLRPIELDAGHLYNLRNQGWGVPRMQAEDGTKLIDPISYFYRLSTNQRRGDVYPSNTDTVVSALYSAPEESSNRTALRFHPKDLIANPLGTTAAPRGSFIIDVLNRGQSRVNAYADMMERYTDLRLDLEDVLPGDQTPGGASVVGSFAGRVWYGGFPSEVVDGDEYSPRLGSYVFFSKLVNDVPDALECYQEGDPTGEDRSDIIATDGGYIRLDGAFGIKGFLTMARSMLVFADNGVWEIRGGDDTGFTAEAYDVRKVTDRGCLSPKSIVGANNSALYWANDGIYVVSLDQLGTYQANNLTKNTIQRFYDEIPNLDKINASGEYDESDKKIKWVYGPNLLSTSNPRELVFDTSIQAFSTNTINTIEGGFPRVISPTEVRPFGLQTTSSEVCVGTELVMNFNDVVTVEGKVRTSAQVNTRYLCITGDNPVSFSFSEYKDEEFLDWKTVDGTGKDASAYLITGYNGGGDYQRNKQITYITTHFRRTETGFELDDDGETIIPVNPSSCMLQSHWDWMDSPNSKRWSREYQAYRRKRLWMPPDSTDDYDDGVVVVSTKNKLRGKGKVVSLKFSTEPGKDLNLLGWSLVMGANTNV